MSSKSPTKIWSVPFRYEWTRGDKLLLVANALAAIAYLVVASRSWAIPEERAAGIYVTTGEPLIWFLTAVPVFAVFAMIDLVWTIRMIWHRSWDRVIACFICGVIWCTAITIDFVHH